MESPSLCPWIIWLTRLLTALGYISFPFVHKCLTINTRVKPSWGRDGKNCKVGLLQITRVKWTWVILGHVLDLGVLGQPVLAVWKGQLCCLFVCLSSDFLPRLVRSGKLVVLNHKKEDLWAHSGQCQGEGGKEKITVSNVELDSFTPD